MPMDVVQEGRINRRNTTQSRRRRLPSHATNTNLQNALSNPIEMEVSNTVTSNTQHLPPQLPRQNSPAAVPLPTEKDGQTTQASATASLSTMSPQERTWWAMSFEEVYQLAKSHGFGKGREGRKSGRVRIIKWLCDDANITPYVAPTIDPTESSHIIRARPVRSTGAISHPEAILRTVDPDLQHKIKEREGHYSGWKHADLTTEAMRRSYQLLKDSEGKLPSRSVKALVEWLAAWDVLKSEREKRWWLGDGIDLVNKAKAIGYSGGSTKKYDVILWLRLTPEDCEVGLEEIKEPTPNKGPSKRRGVDEAAVVETISKRRAKGSTRS